MRKNLKMGGGKFSLLSLLLALFCSLPLYAQNVITVKGKVTNNDEAAVGASILVKETKKGASTNLDGEFVLNDVPKNGTLIVSLVGAKTKEVKVNGRTRIDIVLEDDLTMLDDVVIVAYGSQKKVNLTGAVSSIDSKALAARPVQSVSHALQGLIPGLNLGVTNAGGQLDGTMSINIRGTGTVGGDSSSAPLILIDGVEGNMNALSPEDIESISVLKDASSSAIYGSRAAFGVILITTKSGKEGKVRVNYNGSLRFSTATQIPQMMNSEQFALYFNRAAANSGSGAVFDADKLERIRKYRAGSTDENIKYGTAANPNTSQEPWFLYGNAWADTDWFAEAYMKNAPSHEHNMSISGGTDKFNYYVSGSFLDRRGLLKPAVDEFQRYNTTAKLSAKLANWITVNYFSRWTREDFERPTYLTGLYFHNIARRWPTNPYYDPNGHLAPHNESIQLRDGGRQKNQKDYLAQQLTLVLNPLKGLTFRIENNYNTTVNNTHWSVNPVYNYNKDGNPIPVKWDDWKVPGYTEVREGQAKDNFFSGRYYAEYANIIDKHDFKIVAGMDTDIFKTRDSGITRQDLITPDVPTVNTALNDKPSVYGGYSHWATAGIFGRANYVYDGKYLLEVSVRRDGSSRFIGDKRWATFPSFSLGWNVANESFWSKLKDTVSMFKLRGSWGQLGNTNIKAYYPWFLGLGVGAASQKGGAGWLLGGSRQPYAGVPGIVSNSLTWERVESWNFGLDFAAFNNRLQGNFDFFNRSTKDMVGPANPITSLLGTKRPSVNNSDLKSTGWELELRWRDAIGDFKYGAKFVLSDSQVEITKYNNPTKTINSWNVGDKTGDIWGYTSVGIAKTNEEMNEHLKNNKPSWGSNWAAGDVMYKDLNGDGVINSGEELLGKSGDLRVIGNTTPRYSYSLGLDAEYKGFDFSILLQGIGKRDWINNSPYFYGANTGLWQSHAFTEHWDFFRPEGDELGANLNSYYPRPLFGQGGKNFKNQTRFLQNAAYMRIKNIQLGYTLPKNIASYIGAERVRFYTSVDNLVTFTSLSKIFDPEALGGDWGAGKIYPLQRTWSVGVNVNF